MSRRSATFIGFSAIALWSLLALLTIGSAPVPPFQLNAMTFGIGGLIGLIWTARRGFAVLRGVQLRAYVIGTAGLFGYHALYFTAFRIGPDASTGLIAYLWPLLIVLLSGLLPAEKLRARHVLGAFLGLCGAGVIVLQSGAPGIEPAALILAFICALTWAAYSVISRTMGDVPTEAVTIYCLATAALSALVHLAVETTAWPQGGIGWTSIILLGLGPVGLAFFTWDIGMKRGDIQLLGAASYAAPLLSTLALIWAGITAPSVTIALAAVLVTAGAALAASAPRDRR
jgi:drug/metabolite transporter (DMT)-like permease